jgi:hypothetical protein
MGMLEGLRSALGQLDDVLAHLASFAAAPGGHAHDAGHHLPDAEVRDMVLGTGMTGGMEQSFVRLEREVLAVATALDTSSRIVNVWDD